MERYYIYPSWHGYPIQRFITSDYFMPIYDDPIFGVEPYPFVSKYNLMQKGEKILCSTKQLKNPYSNSKSKYCQNETIKFNRIPIDTKKQTKLHPVVDKIWDISLKDSAHALFELLKLYDIYGKGGNLNVGLGAQRVLTNGFEENNKLKYSSIANQYSSETCIYSIKFPHRPIFELFGDKETTYMLDSNDTILHLKYELIVKPVYHICVTYDDIMFLLTSNLVTIKHLVLVGDVLGYITEAPSYFDQGPVLKRIK